jgi:hypothetical protein
VRSWRNPAHERGADFAGESSVFERGFATAVFERGFATAVFERGFATAIH